MRTLILIFICLITLEGCNNLPKNVDKEPFDSKIDSLLSIMTLEEKAGQLTLYTSGWTVTGPALRDDYLKEVRAGRAGNLFNAHTVAYAKELQRIAVEETRLGIPLLFGLDVIHGYKTTYPIPIAEACSWDMKLIEKTARLSAKEATSAGINWTFNPMVDISRDPRWGRIAEGSGEDVFLGSLIGAAKVRGYQGTDLADEETLLACVKHFAAYGAAEAGRDYHTVDMSDRVLRDTYLPPYKAALDAGAATIMTSFNEIDGVPASGSRYLFTKILREEWGFEGFVVTDYTAINEMTAHGIVPDEKEAAALAFNAGIEMDMQGGVYAKYIPELIREGRILQHTLDTYVRRVLKMKYKLGLFDDPYRYLDEEREKNTLFSEEFMNHSLQAARESIVLLKNEGQLLPLSKDLKNIALIGPLGDNQKDLLGTWHVAGMAEKVITLKQGIEKVVPQSKVSYAQGTGFSGTDKSGFSNAIALAQRSDVVVMAVGENYEQSGEAASRTDLGLPGNQSELIKEIMKLGKPMVIVLMSGRPLTIEWLNDEVPAILNTWHLGTMAGQAIAETLFGENNPSGKLTITFPRNVGQIPIYYNMKNTGRPFEKNNKYTSKYLDVSNDPLYPFGYGLSYTSFEYSNLKIDKKEIGFDENILISVDIENTGGFDGEEVTQLYIRDLVGSVTRAVRELKGFEKVFLRKGERKTLKFTISSDDLRFHNIDMDFIAEPGGFQVFVGADSNATLSEGFVLRQD